MATHPRIKLAEDVVELLENKFKIGPFKFGLDPILGLVPFIGDLIPTIISLYLVFVAWEQRVAKATIVKMIGLIVADYVIGSIPIVGDIIDFFFRVHTHNLKILKQELTKNP